MKFMNYVSLTDGYVERFDINDLEPGMLGRVFERVLVPVFAGKSGRSHDYTVTGDLTKKRGFFRINRDDAEVADVTVCLHSKHSRAMWARVYDDHLPDMVEPSVPWVAMRYYCDESELPSWLDVWCKHLAWSLDIHRDEFPSL